MKNVCKITQEKLRVNCTIQAQYALSSKAFQNIRPFVMFILVVCSLVLSTYPCEQPIPASPLPVPAPLPTSLSTNLPTDLNVYFLWCIYIPKWMMFWHFLAWSLVLFALFHLRGGKYCQKCYFSRYCVNSIESENENKGLLLPFWKYYTTLFSFL